MKERVGEKEAEILEGHVLLLMDPEMTGQMETSIADDKMCAEAAVEKICDYYKETGKLPRTSGCSPDDFMLVFDAIHTAHPNAQILYLAYSAVTT